MDTTKLPYTPIATMDRIPNTETPNTGPCCLMPTQTNPPKQNEAKKKTKLEA